MKLWRWQPSIITLLLVALLAGALLLAWRNCPATGCAFSAALRSLNRLKNRTAHPRPEVFDPHVTLMTLLAPGADQARWSQARAAAVEGYVVAVGQGPLECANCFMPGRRDVHIDLALRPDAQPSERLVVEVTPLMQDWARGQGEDWSAAALTRRLLERRCRIEGWLLFDSRHAAEAEHTNPGAGGNWRATAWELHPVTAIEESQ